LSCYVFSDCESDAIDAAYDYNNRHSEDFDENSDSDGDTDFEYSELSIELDESDVDSPDGNNNESAINLAMQLPSKYIEDLILI
jgi:hypothetical protein